jgi:PAS domain S-box-containing protein
MSASGEQMPYSNRTPFNLQSIIDASDNGFVVIDKNYNIVAANEAYCNAYGISSDEIIGHKCHQVSHHSDVPCHLNGEDCPHKQVFETKKTHQVLHIHFDANNEEEHVRIKGSPVYGTDGELFLGEAVFPIAKSDDMGCSQQRMLGKSPSFLACVEEMSAGLPLLTLISPSYLMEKAVLVKNLLQTLFITNLRAEHTHLYPSIALRFLKESLKVNYLVMNVARSLAVSGAATD